MPEDLPGLGPHELKEPESIRITVAKTIQDIDNDGKGGGEDNEDNLGQDAVAQPEDQNGSQGNGGNGLDHHKDGIEHLIDPGITVHDEGQDTGDENPQTQTQEGRLQGVEAMLPEKGPVSDKGLHDFYGSRQDILGQELEEASQLPNHQEQEDAQATDLFTYDSVQFSPRWTGCARS